MRLTEYPRGQFSLPYPDRHSDRYTLIEVTMFAGRSMGAKASSLRRQGGVCGESVVAASRGPMRAWRAELGRRSQTASSRRMLAPDASAKGEERSNGRH